MTTFAMRHSYMRHMGGGKIIHGYNQNKTDESVKMGKIEGKVEKKGGEVKDEVIAIKKSIVKDLKNIKGESKRKSKRRMTDKKPIKGGDVADEIKNSKISKSAKKQTDVEKEKKKDEVNLSSV